MVINHGYILSEIIFRICIFLYHAHLIFILIYKHSAFQSIIICLWSLITATFYLKSFSECVLLFFIVHIWSSYLNINTAFQSVLNSLWSLIIDIFILNVLFLFFISLSYTFEHIYVHEYIYTVKFVNLLTVKYAYSFACGILIYCTYWYLKQTRHAHSFIFSLKHKHHINSILF